MSVKSASGQHTLREQNLALVAQEIFLAPTPISRATVSGRTGLTRATVSALVDFLVDAGIVAELEPVAPKGAGRPAVPLVPAKGTYFGIGLEVTVTSLVGVIYDLTGTQLAHLEILHRPNLSPDQTFQALARLTTELIARASKQVAAPPGVTPVIAGVALALPGLVDPNSGSLRIAPNLGWQNLDPVDTSAIAFAIAEATGQNVTVTIGNEAKFGAIAQTFSSDLSTFIYVSSDVGIGSTIMMNGAPFFGRRGWSGELGHVTIDPDGPRCTCGSLGCLEQYAGRNAVFKAAGLDQDAHLHDLLSSVQDGPGLEAIGRAGAALGAALSDYVNLIDIDTIVLGGIYAPLTPYLQPVIVATLKDKVLSAQWSQFSVVAAPVEFDAAPIGAARQVLRGVYEHPAQWINQEPV